MIYILESVCSDYALATILIILKRLLNFVQIFVPIILIISVIVQLIKKVLNPEDGGRGGSMKNIINSFMAAVIVVFLPFIINLAMSTISEYGEVGIKEDGSLTALDVTSCWQVAETRTEVLDSSLNTTSSTISAEKAQNRVSLSDDPSYYEEAKKELEEIKKKEAEANINTGDGYNTTTGLPIPVMYQGDYANVSLCGGNVATNGCGWTSLAMIMSYLTGKTITPADIISWSGIKGCMHMNGGGMLHDFANTVAIHYGFQKPIYTEDASLAVQALKNNQPVMSSQGPGLFTKGGHLIVLRGIDSENKIYVNDPNRRNAITNGYINRGFTVGEIDQAAGHYFIFEKKSD